MSNGQIVVSPAEKTISIISYFTMGIAGLIWIIIAYFFNKRLKFFLMYNITQSMIISIFLALLHVLIKVILQIMIAIPFLSSLGITINIQLQSRFHILGLSFNIIELFVFILLIYISLGVIRGKILFVPFLTKAMKVIMRSYH